MFSGVSATLLVFLYGVAKECALSTGKLPQGGLPRDRAVRIIERRHEKTNVLVSDLVRHKPGCTATEDS